MSLEYNIVILKPFCKPLCYEQIVTAHASALLQPKRLPLKWGRREDISFNDFTWRWQSRRNVLPPLCGGSHWNPIHLSCMSTFPSVQFPCSRRSLGPIKDQFVLVQSGHSLRRKVAGSLCGLCCCLHCCLLRSKLKNGPFNEEDDRFIRKVPKVRLHFFFFFSSALICQMHPSIFFTAYPLHARGKMKSQQYRLKWLVSCYVWNSTNRSTVEVGKEGNQTILARFKICCVTSKLRSRFRHCSYCASKSAFNYWAVSVSNFFFFKYFCWVCTTQ